MDLPKHFDFMNWEQMFTILKYYRESCAEKVILTLSTEFYSSGYWIELKRIAIKHPDQCIFYKTDEEINGLENKIKENERLKLIGKGKSGLII